MTVLSARYWPSKHDPAREGALVKPLTSNREGCYVETYDHKGFWAKWDELEVLVQTEGD